MYAVCGLLTICMGVIEIAAVTDDFSLKVVAEHSSIETPLGYKLASMWSSQEGSLLLWAWVLSIASSAALFVTRNKHREIVPWATAVLMGVGSFFIALTLFAARPFAMMTPVPADGVGLQPLLQHPTMLIHPPMLYSGYVFFTIPFAFAIGALITRSIDASWIRSTRRFALIAWTFLGIGLLLGARWSYTELGWGGYWAWDPVENAALMPWLMGTAFLHSVMVQEKRGMLKVWNVSLVVATFSLCLLGTFLVRSGVLQSIHAFGDSTVGPYLLGLIGVVLIGSTVLIVSRLDSLQSEKRIDSLASREAVFLVNNLLLVALVAVILFGTFFPLISEALTGTKHTLAAPWFDKWSRILAIGLVLFTGIGPLLAWRRISASAARRVFLLPAAFALVVALLLAVLTNATEHPWAFAIFAFAGFTLCALAQELVQAGAARRSLAGGSLPAGMLAVAARNRRRYGGYTVHAGIVVLLVGIAASSSFQTNRDIRLSPGQSEKVDDYTLTYVRPTSSVDDRRVSFGAILRVEKDGKKFATMTPTRQFFVPTGTNRGPTVRSVFSGEPTTEVGLDAGLRNDLWTAVTPDISGVIHDAKKSDDALTACLRGGPAVPLACRQLGDLMRAAAADPSLRPRAFAQITGAQDRVVEQLTRSYAQKAQPATFRVIVNPLVSWMWIGALIAIAGALISVWPTPGARRRRVSSVEAARVGQGLSRA